MDGSQFLQNNQICIGDVSHHVLTFTTFGNCTLIGSNLPAANPHQITHSERQGNRDGPPGLRGVELRQPKVGMQKDQITRGVTVRLCVAQYS